jgi:hypothetical protein
MWWCWTDVARPHGSHTFPPGPFADLAQHFDSVPALAEEIGACERALRNWANGRTLPQRLARQRVEALCDEKGVDPPDWTAQATVWRRQA